MMHPRSLSLSFMSYPHQAFFAGLLPQDIIFAKFCLTGEGVDVVNSACQLAQGHTPLLGFDGSSKLGFVEF